MQVASHLKHCLSDIHDAYLFVKIGLCAFFLTMMSGLAQATDNAVQIPELPIYLTPPPDFTPSTQFKGFIQTDSESSIVVRHIRSPYAAYIETLGAGAFAVKKMKLIKQESVQLGEQTGQLLTLEESVEGRTFLRWMVVIGHAEDTYTITAQYPKVLDRYLGQPLKESVLSTRLRLTPPDPFARFPFSLTVKSPLRLVGEQEQVLHIIHEDLFFGALTTEPDINIYAVSLSDADTDKKALAENELRKARLMRNIQIAETIPFKIQDLEGFSTKASAEHGRIEKPFFIYQIILFQEKQAFVIRTLMGTEKQETYLPIVDALIQSLTLKPEKLSEKEKVGN